MAKLARKTAKIRILANVIDDMASLQPEFSAIKKRMEKLEQELKDFLGDDIKKDGIYKGYLFDMVLKRLDPDPMYLDNEKVLSLIGSDAYEKCKSPRPTVRKTFIKKD